MKKLKLSISLKNRKMGPIPSVSLPQILTCRPDAPCRKLCYSGAHIIWQQPRASYERNLALWEADPGQYFIDLWTWLRTANTSLFRWHVSGDIPCQTYYEAMKETARRFPHVRFLAFTKRYDILTFGTIPDNLSMVMSIWPGLAAPDNGLPRAYFWDPRHPDPRIDEYAMHCREPCVTCRLCWHLREVNTNVVLKRH